MSREDIFITIKEVINDVASISKEEIREDSSLMEDLELSSMELFMMLGTLEMRLKVRFPESEVRSVETVSDLINLTLSKIN